MVDFKEAGVIIKCPICGTQNRVGAYDSNLRPVCGRCRSSLDTSIEALSESKSSGAQKIYFQLRDSNNQIKLFIMIVLFLFLICFGFIYYQLRQPHQTLLTDQSLIRKLGQTQLPSQTVIEHPKKTIPIQQLPKTNRRLDNGTIIHKSTTKGLGELTVKNGLSTDAVAKLIEKQTERCKAFFYISSGNQFTLTSIDDGHYRLIFGTGEDWDQANKFFRHNKAFSEFEKLMVFKTSKESSQFSVNTKYTVMEVTLHPVIQGNIRTSTISEEEFLKY